MEGSPEIHNRPGNTSKGFCSRSGVQLPYPFVNELAEVCHLYTLTYMSHPSLYSYEYIGLGGMACASYT